MASYGFNLYFDKKLQREEMLRRIQALPDCKPVPDQAGTCYFEYVHLRLSQNAQSRTPKEIHQACGLQVGDFYVNVAVGTAADEAFEEKWDRTLDLLAPGEDAIAIKELGWILLIHRDGQLTLDNSNGMLSPHYRAYIANKRPAQIAPLGELPESD